MSSRRPKFDKCLQDAFCDLLKEGVGRTAACKKLNVARSTFNRHLNSNQKFNEAVHAAEMDANEVIEMALFSTAKKGNVTAQQVWLYNRSPERWQDKRNVTVGGDKENPIEVHTKVELSLNEILAEYYGSENSSSKDNPADDIPEPVHPTQTDQEAV